MSMDGGLRRHSQSYFFYTRYDVLRIEEVYLSIESLRVERMTGSVQTLSIILL